MTVAYETNALTAVFFELRYVVLDQGKDLSVRRWFYRQMNEVYDELYVRTVRGGDKVANGFRELIDQQGDSLTDQERAELMS